MRDNEDHPDRSFDPFEHTDVTDFGTDAWARYDVDASEAEATEAPPPPRPPASQFRPRRRLAFWLFVATCVSTLFSGMIAGLGMPNPVWLFRTQPVEVLLQLLWNGVCYAGPLMLILLAHEMGHYLQARRYGVPATLPYFIPMPFSPFGTMGAVILQGAGVADRRALFDIAISGPLAGLVVALPVAYFGLAGTQVVQVDPNAAAIRYGDPLILRWMAEWIHGPLGDNEDVLLTPLLFAGWVGIFITALNLIPIGQLDGGHVLYALMRRRAHTIALALIALAVGFMVTTGDYSYSLMVILLLLIGVRHPPTANDFAPLGPVRVVLGWLTLGFVVIGFTPTPIMLTPGAVGEPRKQNHPELPPPDAENPIIWTRAVPSGKPDRISELPAAACCHIDSCIPADRSASAATVRARCSTVRAARPQPCDASRHSSVRTSFVARTVRLARTPGQAIAASRYDGWQRSVRPWLLPAVSTAWSNERQ